MPPRVPLPPQLNGTAFTVATGHKSGLSRSRLRGGDLHRPFRGVRTTFTTDTVTELCRAYLARMPEHAFFCGVTAACILGVPLPHHLEASRVLRVAVPAPHRAPAGRGVKGSMVQVAPHDVRVRYGIRVSSPARTWCELGAELDVADLVAAGDYLIHWRHPLASRDELERAVTTHPSGRGRRALRESLLHLDERSESRKESLLRLIVVRGGIAGIVANLVIRTSGGFTYRADLAVPSRKVIIEYQSDYHGDMPQFRRDMTRRARLEADGWVVILVNADDLRNAAELVTRIRTAITGRPVVARP